MKTIIETRLVQPNETYLRFNEHTMDYEQQISVEGYNNHPVPVIIAEVENSEIDFSEAIEILMSGMNKINNEERTHNIRQAITVLLALK